MKYFFCLIIVLSLFSCFKEEDNPCFNYVNDPVPYSPLVFSFTDANNNNLLENKTIDTTQISMQDGKGNKQTFMTFLDTTGTKTLYVSVPIQTIPGTNELKVTAQNKVTYLKYDFAIVDSQCGSYHRFDNYLLNSIPYTIQNVAGYTLVGKQKIRVQFRVISIRQ